MKGASHGACWVPTCSVTIDSLPALAVSIYNFTILLTFVVFRTCRIFTRLFDFYDFLDFHDFSDVHDFSDSR